MLNSELIALESVEQKPRTTTPARLTRSVLTPLIKPGTLVVNHWLLCLPESLRTGGYPYGSQSRIYPAAMNSQVQCTLANAGWQFLRMEPLVRTRAIAAQREEALRRALGKALRKVRKENLNALEVVEVKVQKFLGWHLATLVAQARQVQISPRYDYGGCGQVLWPVAS
jgi:hypothetical protein